MADYFAVLQRTLSGFSDPKPQLRTKLYERARVTIAKQLETRVPPVTGDALSMEMDKLEKAIATIEQGYDPSYPDPVPTTEPAPTEPTPVEPEPEVVSDPEPILEPVQEPEPEPDAVIEPEEEVVAPIVEQEAAIEIEPAVTPILEPEVVVSPPEVSPEVEAFLEAELPAAVDPVFEEQLPDLAVSQEVETAAQAPFEAGIADALDALQPDVPAVDPTPTSTPDPITNDPVAPNNPVGQWAEEFSAAQPQPEPAPVLPPAAVLPELDPIPDPAQIPYQQQEITAAPPVFEPQYDNTSGETLSIPPAAGFGAGGSKRPKKRGFGKWIVLLLLLGLLGALGTYGWMNKELVLEKTGIGKFLEDPNDPTRPKPVKTITITPEPAEPEADDTSSAEPEPKVERRLTADGAEIETVTPKPVESPTVTPALPAATETTTTNTGAPLVAQKAILYEEGATASENTADAGRVVWSVVEESPAAGEPKESAIRARIEIPSRNTVLIMTIKRNGDRALPASHLIELIFAVPDDFSGGAIGQVNRFVLKESEQGRGEGLVAVPARIADGIFLIALNNLDEAKSKNETLLQSRNWIDIPLQYRTGRRALVTIEKGLPGEQVFKEVFEAWAKL